MAVSKKATTAAMAVMFMALLFAAEPASAYIWPWGPIHWPISIGKPHWPPFKWPPHFPKPCFIDCWQQVVAERTYHKHPVNYFVIVDYCTDFCSDWSISFWGEVPGIPPHFGQYSERKLAQRLPPPPPQPSSV